MSDPKEIRADLSLADRATLSLLSALEDDGPVTQRGLSVRIGVALGLTNSLLKRAVRKGLVKVKEAPTKRFAYYVTPKGFGEKSRLVADYISSSLDFFRQARDEYASIYQDIKQKGCHRIVLFGTGEIAEIAILSARDHEIALQAMVSIDFDLDQFSGLLVLASMDELLSFAPDAIVITSSETPQDDYTLLRKHYQEHQIYTVPLMHVSRHMAERNA